MIFCFIQYEDRLQEYNSYVNCVEDDDFGGFCCYWFIERFIDVLVFVYCDSYENQFIGSVILVCCEVSYFIEDWEVK